MTLAERWNGTSWTIQSTPNPTGALECSYLQGVSCTSATACTAVGSYANSAGNTGDAGRALERHQLDDPAHPQPGRRRSGSYLEGVSCTSATACTAVGYSDDDIRSR